MNHMCIVNKDGLLKHTSVKNFSEEELYKKCSLKKSDGFKKIYELIDLNSPDLLKKIIIYGKQTGRNGHENIHKFNNMPIYGSFLMIGFSNTDELVCINSELYICKKYPEINIIFMKSEQLETNENLNEKKKIKKTNKATNCEQNEQTNANENKSSVSDSNETIDLTNSTLPNATTHSINELCMEEYCYE